MKSKLTKVLTIFLCIFIIISSFQLFVSVLVRNTVFSERFYENVTESRNYIPMLTQVISYEFDAQSRFAGIPLEYFTAALNDEIISEIQTAHIKNSIQFLRKKHEFVKVEYPSELFMNEFEKFIESVKAENDEFEEDENLYKQLGEVAEDSSGIIEKHVNILRFDLIKEMQIFKKTHNLILLIASLAIPAFIILIISTALLFYIYRKKIDKAVFFLLTSLWIFGAVLFIPGIVIRQSGITHRLSINTSYFKFAVDTWLGKLNDSILITGAVIFTLTSAALIGRFIYNQKRNSDDYKMN